MSDTEANPSVLNKDDAALSLLSLSIAAAQVQPIEVDLTSPSNGASVTRSAAGTANTIASVGTAPKQHRRLSSTGKARRRLSDARDAATRPSPALLQTTAAALSLASLSLSTSPPAPGQQISTSLASATASLASAPDAQAAIPIPVSRTSSSASPGTPKSLPLDSLISASPETSHQPSSATTKGGKKRGTDHKCESCSKIYRHPSCLIKHRWEHTPQWREASKFVLSKHQQVQLLEAAAILSHLSPSSSTGTSLPEDRSLWPSFLSGGALPPPSGTSVGAAHPVSSSVPASTLLGSPGPRLHDYAVKGASGITQLRPGLLGVPTGQATTPSDVAADQARSSLPSSAAVPVPITAKRSTSSGSKSELWGSPVSLNYPAAGSYGTGGWSLPRSSMRSVSGSSRSRSASDDESEFVEVEAEPAGVYSGYSFSSRGRWKREEDDMSVGFSVQEEDEDELEIDRGKHGQNAWDGIEMEMEMD